MMPSYRVLVTSLIFVMCGLTNISASYLTKYLRNKSQLGSVMRKQQDKRIALQKKVLDISRLAYKQHHHSDFYTKTNRSNKTAEINLNYFTHVAQQLLDSGVTFREMVEALSKTNQTSKKVSFGLLKIFSNVILTVKIVLHLSGVILSYLYIY